MSALTAARKLGRSPGAATTSERILDTAELLTRQRGFNGFSYADIAAELELSKPSLHYHFRTKAELGLALIERYNERFIRALARIDAAGADARRRLGAYVALYAEVLDGGRMCLCGILAAEYQTLSAPMQRAVVTFFERNEAWLAAVLDQGRREGTLRFEGSPSVMAQALLGGLEGALLVSHSFADPARFEASAHRLLSALVGAGSDSGEPARTW